MERYSFSVAFVAFVFLSGFVWGQTEGNQARAKSKTIVSEPAKWCTVIMPAEVSPGERISYTIEYKGIESTVYLSANLAWVRDDGRRGYIDSAKLQSVEIRRSGQQEFIAAVEGIGPRITGIVAFIYLSTDGNYKNRISEPVSSDVTPVKGVFEKASLRPKMPDGKVLSEPAEWCTVIMPEKVSVGEEIEYTVEYDKAPESYLSANLAWVRGDGMRRYLTESKPAKVKIQGAGQQTFTATIIEKGANMAGVLVFIYLSSDGDYSNRIDNPISSDVIPVVGKSKDSSNLAECVKEHKPTSETGKPLIQAEE